MRSGRRVCRALLTDARHFNSVRAAHRQRWRQGQHRLTPEQLVFIDETWASTAMARSRGQAPRGERLVSAVPHGYWKTTTFVAGLRQAGVPLRGHTCARSRLMAIRDITRAAVEQALQEFRRTGRHRMRDQYGGGFSTRWYIRHGGRCYDQKLVMRAAHDLLCRSRPDLDPLPTGSRRPRAGQVRKRLERLGFEVVAAEQPGSAGRTAAEQPQ